MSSLHRNALLPENEDTCLNCGAPVELPADYCDGCLQDSVAVALHSASSALAAGSRRAKTAKPVEREASQSGPNESEGNAQ